MNLSKLTFSQCQRLCSPDNLARLQTAYASQLRRAWNFPNQSKFMVSTAEHFFPEIAERWKIIRAAWLALQDRLAELADLEDTPQTRAYWAQRRRAQVQIDRFAFDLQAYRDSKKHLENDI